MYDIPRAIVFFSVYICFSNAKVCYNILLLVGKVNTLVTSVVTLGTVYGNTFIY